MQQPWPRTNLGPLTTPFTYPASCSANALSCTVTGCPVAWQAQTCDVIVKDNPSCWPPPAAGVLTPAAPLSGWGFYSPAFSCPVGYSSACVTTSGGPGSFTFQFALLNGETAVGCCPPGYSCTNPLFNPNLQSCVTVLYTGSFPAYECSGSTSTGLSDRQAPFLFTTAGETITESSITLWAPLFQLNHQATDTSSAGGASGGTPTVTESVPVTINAGGSTNVSAPGKGGLSPGAAGGVGAAAAIVGVAIIGAIAATAYFCGRRQRRTQQLPPTDPQMQAGHKEQLVSAPETQTHATQAIFELRGELPIYEAPT